MLEGKRVVVERVHRSDAEIREERRPFEGTDIDLLQGDIAPEPVAIANRVQMIDPREHNQAGRFIGRGLLIDRLDDQRINRIVQARMRVEMFDERHHDACLPVIEGAEFERPGAARNKGCERRTRTQNANQQRTSLQHPAPSERDGFVRRIGFSWHVNLL